MDERTALARWMAANGYSDDDLAAALGVSRVQALRLRTGQNRPSVERAAALEKLTDISIHTLLTEPRRHPTPRAQQAAA